ncbi:Mitochondrial substrate carrier family protein [Forsythia ovata]|uniref:Mitochondrial substrate carrier family protein n=1 Tax=Forsythia ovata TaxID=205694 RepID=A0ABD1S890_9LAMI
MGEEKPKSTGVWATVKPFVNGGASGMLATCVIRTPLMLAAMHGNISCVKKLIEAGANYVQLSGAKPKEDKLDFNFDANSNSSAVTKAISKWLICCGFSRLARGHS